MLRGMREAHIVLLKFSKMKLLSYIMLYKNPSAQLSPQTQPSALVLESLVGYFLKHRDARAKLMVEEKQYLI
jgi:hypothetical protein